MIDYCPRSLTRLECDLVELGVPRVQDRKAIESVIENSREDNSGSSIYSAEAWLPDRNSADVQNCHSWLMSPLKNLEQKRWDRYKLAFASKPGTHPPPGARIGLTCHPRIAGLLVRTHPPKWICAAMIVEEDTLMTYRHKTMHQDTLALREALRKAIESSVQPKKEWNEAQNRFCQLPVPRFHFCDEMILARTMEKNEAIQRAWAPGVEGAKEGLKSLSRIRMQAHYRQEIQTIIRSIERTSVARLPALDVGTEKKRAPRPAVAHEVHIATKLLAKVCTSFYIHASDADLLMHPF